MKTQIIFLFTMMFLFINELLLAQSPPGLPPVPDSAPIDGGLGLVAAAGGAYALKKLRDRKIKEGDADMR